MGKMIFITGGCRSGKSSFAVDLAKKEMGRVAFIATAEGFDREMRERIKEHRRSRPAAWKTFEEPRDLSRLLASTAADFNLVIIDCVTIYLSNLLLKGHTPARIREEMRRVIRAIKESPCRFIVVSNEVGAGIVPVSAMGRKFRDIAGEVNKSLAAAAQRAYLLVAGIAVKLK